MAQTTVSIVAERPLIPEHEGSFAVRFVRTGSTAGTITAHIGIADGTARRGLDYDAPADTFLTFAPGETEKSITITIIDDPISEWTEDLIVRFLTVNGGAIGSVAQFGPSITDDDPLVTITVAPPEPISEAAPDVTLTLVRNGPTTYESTALVRVAENEAKAGVDFVAPPDQLVVFPPRVSSIPFRIPILDDSLIEGDEFFTVRVEGVANAVGESATRVVIRDDEPAAFIDFSARQYPVGENGGSVTLTVLRTGNLSATASVRYRSFNSEATSGLDYTPVSGTLTFGPGEAAKTITVPILEDAQFEGPESFLIFLIFLDQFQNVLMRGTTAFVAIADDDPASFLSFATASQSVPENGGTANVEIRRTGALEQPASVQYSMIVGTPAATHQQDYVATSETIRFAPGETSKTLPVTIFDDDVMEGPEQFVVVLIGSSGALLADIQRDTVTILDDDQAVFITSPVTGIAVTEGGVASFEVRCSGLTSGTVTVDYADLPGTAVRGSDYETLSGTLVFTPTDTVKTIAVRTLEDSTAELRESFTIRLTPHEPVQLDSANRSIAIDDNDAVQLTVSDAVITEGDAGTRDAVFTVSVSAPFPEYLRFIAETEGGTATAYEDFLISDQYVDLPRGTTTATVRVPVRGDTLAEGDETSAVRWLRANAARFALDDEHFIAWGGPLAALLGTTNGVASLEDLSQGNPAVSSAVQGAINTAGPLDAAYITPDDPPFLVTRPADAADIDAATAFHQALLAAGSRSTLKIAAADDAVDGFLDALTAAPRRRSAGR